MTNQSKENGFRRLAESALRQHPTPFFLYDADRMGKQVAALKAAFHDSVDIFYSFKANPNLSVCALMREKGAHAEICSYPELLLAEAAGYAPENTIFVGPAKEPYLIRELVRRNIYAIVVESARELEYIAQAAEELDRRPRIALRLNPIFSNPKAPLKMGGVPSQFGMDASEVAKAIEYLRHPRLRITGLHVYNGTRILDAQSIAANCASVFRLAEEVVKNLGIELEVLDFGGGFGVPYFDGESPLDLDALASTVAHPLAEFRAKYPMTRIIAESGRFLTAEAGTLFSEVLYVKEAFGKKFAITNAGINCHLAATGIGSFLRRNFPVSCFNVQGAPTESYTITGPLCTPSDIVAQDLKLPPIATGDIIQVEMSGAYGPSASPGYFLSHAFPMELLAHEGEIHVVRERDRYEDIFRNHKNIFARELDRKLERKAQ